MPSSRKSMIVEAAEAWVESLLWDRIPLKYLGDPKASEKCTALAKEFAACESVNHDPETLLETLIPWARDRGYEVSDLPRSPYAEFDRNAQEGAWGPR